MVRMKVDATMKREGRAAAGHTIDDDARSAHAAGAVAPRDDRDGSRAPLPSAFRRRVANRPARARRGNLPRARVVRPERKRGQHSCVAHHDGPRHRRGRHRRRAARARRGRVSTRHRSHAARSVALAEGPAGQNAARPCAGHHGPYRSAWPRVHVQSSIAQTQRRPVMTRFTSVLVLAAALVISASAGVHGQVGKSLGILDANTVPESELTALPHMTPAIVKGLLEKRGTTPFMSILELNTFLQGQGLSAQQATDFYGKAFIHINLNTATRDEIILI